MTETEVTTDEMVKEARAALKERASALAAEMNRVLSLNLDVKLQHRRIYEDGVLREHVMEVTAQRLQS